MGAIRSFFLAVMVLSTAAAAQTNRYVWTDSPSPGAPFNAWTNAAHTIQDAVDASVAGDTVWVTNGVYADGGRPASGMLLTNRVMIPAAITVQSVNGPLVTTIQGQGPFGLSAVRGAFLTNGAVLNGFRIEHGRTLDYADAADTPDQHGGGILALGDADIDSCHIVSNQACHKGGGVYGESLGVIFCQMDHNEAEDGAGAYLVNGQLHESELRWNLASPGYGGGAYLKDSDTSNCTLEGNNGYWGGGLLMEGGTADNLTAVSNTAVAGGGIAAAESYLTNLFLLGNTVSGHGGGAYLEMCWITGSVISNNDLAWLESTNTAAYGGGIASTVSLIENCSIRNNRGFDDDDCGGGLSCWPVGAWTTRVVACTFRDNSAGNGGGIYVFPDALCDVRSSDAGTADLHYNTATNFGGGICVDTQGVFQGTGDLVIAGNHAANGGGLAALDGTRIDIQEADAMTPVFYDNIAGISGGGLFATGALTQITLRDVQIGRADDKIQGNWAKGASTANGGGGLALYGATLAATDLRVEYNQCSSNYGGGILLRNAQATLDSTDPGSFSAARPRTLLARNSATNSQGGAIYAYQSQLAIQDAVLAENSARLGGGIYATSSNVLALDNLVIAFNNASVLGGGLRIYDATTGTTGLLRHCTVYGNAIEGIAAGGGVTLSLTNCIVYTNASAQVSAGFTVACSDIQDGYAGTGNIDAPPFFLDAPATNFHLTVDSTGSVVDAGTDAGLTRDCVFRARPHGAGFDMGAFEYNRDRDDFDGDTIPDGWETDHGLDPRNPADAALFSDSDPVVNLDEYLADTDPLDSNDYFRLTDCYYNTNHPERGILVAFTSSSNRLYSLYSTEALSNHCTWTAMPGQTNIQGVGTYDGLNDTNSPAGFPARTYRILVTRPPE